MPKPLGTYALIDSVVLSTNQATISFSNIPGTYTDLVLVIYGRSNNSAVSDTYLMTLNGNTGNNYGRTRILGTGSSASCARRTSAPNIDFEGLAGNTASSGVFQVAKVNIMDYSNTTTNKTVIIRGDDSNNYVLFTIGTFLSTSAITSISLAPSTGTQFVTGTTVKLYGITAGNQ